MEDNLPIKIYGEPILREKARKVMKIEEADLLMMEKMVDAMFANEGIGLAAPQIGIGKQIIVVRNGKEIIKLINPVIFKKESEEEAKEGCLSLPDIYVDVKRAAHISVKGRNEKWEDVIIEAEGLTARVFQHEIDHLNGVLIIDYASPVSEVAIKTQLKKLRRL
ncbi:MAG: peptide deformylase [Candidatus Ratteibacteria bacterium]|nr:peptide deformylase [Candidatus Ratteibacteria bacterium]